MKQFILRLKSWVVLPFFGVILLVSCSESNKQSIDKAGKSIEIAKVVDNQSGIIDSVLNYCYFLPKTYNGTEKLPVIYFLDPHANGSKALNNYADLANKYGYIFIGSNTIKNGQAPDYTMRVFQKLMAETKKRFVIDEKRMFAAGFSGGAKLAIIFTQQIPEIIGVAACGASLPLTADYKPHYYYAGIVGNEDFNYLETNQTFSSFEQRGFDYTSEIFNGGHQWPPIESFEMAVIGFEIYAMKLKLIPTNKEWLSVIGQKMNDSIAIFKERDQVLHQNIYTRQAIRWFYGLKNTKVLNAQAYQIENSAAFINQVKKQQKLIQTEVKLRAEFIRAIELRDLEWWTLEINRINKSIGQSDKDLARVSQRLMNYLSMVSFMLVKSDLEQLKLENVPKKLKIYEYVDPTNPDVYLMYARYYMTLEDVESMINSFKKAQELGFKDNETYKNENLWKGLFENEKIKSLM